MHTQKIMLLDWDGTVRADYFDPQGATADVEIQQARLKPFPVKFDDGESCIMLIDPSALARLAAITDRADVTIFWLSANG
jgi:hypothetical protein